MTARLNAQDLFDPFEVFDTEGAEPGQLPPSDAARMASQQSNTVASEALRCACSHRSLGHSSNCRRVLTLSHCGSDSVGMARYDADDDDEPRPPPLQPSGASATQSDVEVADTRVWRTPKPLPAALSDCRVTHKTDLTCSAVTNASLL